MFDTVERVGNLIYRLNKLADLSMYGESEGVVTEELIHEITFNARKWEKIIRKSFDTWFIKHANLEVLRRKKNEIEND